LNSHTFHNRANQIAQTLIQMKTHWEFAFTESLKKIDYFFRLYCLRSGI
jgi:hypothetical protein